MANSVRDRLDKVHPQMLRADMHPDPQKLGDDIRAEIGQAFEWALDRSRLTKQEAAFRMGYTDSGVIGRWISGAERLQLDKLRLLGDEFFREFVMTLGMLVGGVVRPSLEFPPQRVVNG